MSKNEANYEIELRGGYLNLTRTGGKGETEFYGNINLRQLRQQLPVLIESRQILKEMLKQIDDILKEAEA